jgi:hypothetical protein
MTCQHNFHFDIKCAMFEDKPGNGSLDITGHCKKCNVPLIFQGPRGAAAPYPVVSIDRTELRAPVTFGYDVEFKPSISALVHGEELVPSGKKDYQS